MRKLWFLLVFPILVPVYGQVKAHSHNDYEQNRPFFLAYELGFDSIEADVFLRNDSLFVAHESRNIHSENTFSRLYLLPVIEICAQNKGKIYPDKELQLLIDLKTDYQSILPVLIRELGPYKKYLYPKGKVKIVISGSMPEPDDFSVYPKYIYFDGRPEIEYSKKQLKKVALISQSFRKYSWWNGRGELSEKDLLALKEVISRVHALKKPIRFWAVPDQEDAWQAFIDLGVDYLNTDKLEELRRFLDSIK